jgi:peptidyl-prolyl cis-trans isomerase C
MQTIALHHILIKSPLLAEDLAKELELGADFAEIAREYSACPSAKEGGFAGYHHQDDLPLAVITALANCHEEKSFTGPVKTQFGYHLLKPVGEKPKLAISDDDIAEENLAEPVVKPDAEHQVEQENKVQAIVEEDEAISN